LIRNHRDDFDKGDLKDELERAGFDKCMADDIIDRVDDRKADGWTYNTGREEAIREAQMLIDSSKAALNRYKSESVASENAPSREGEAASARYSHERHI
jgi:hypothetical protein